MPPRILIWTFRKCLTAASLFLLTSAGPSQAAADNQTETVSKPATPPSQPSPQPNAVKITPYDVTINHAAAGQWTLLETDGALYAQEDALKEWRLIPPRGMAPMVYRRLRWLPLFVLPGYRARFDYNSQSVELEFSGAAFEGTELSDEQLKPPELSPIAPSAFLNYDISNTFTNSAASGSARNMGAMTELGLSLGYGTLVSSFFGNNLVSSDTTTAPKWTRLETTWAKDFPEKQLSMRLGDTSTHASMWGRTVYFGGFQIGSNFSLTPSFITYAIPTLGGTAATPSTVELYVNNVLRQTTNVGTGPFTINNFNQLTGAGDASVVVKDILGRETITTRSFFANSNLLAKDLTDWSLSIGKMRYNLGVANSDYRDTFTSLIYRRGVSNELTMEGRSDYSATRKALGLGMNAGLPFRSILQSAVALSQDNDYGRGQKLLLGLDQQSLDTGFGFKTIYASENYREIGFTATDVPYKREQNINYRHGFGKYGFLGLSYGKIAKYDGQDFNVYSASYSLRVGEKANLYFSYNRITGQTPGHSLGIALNIPLDNRKNATASYSNGSAGLDTYAGVTAPMDFDTGIAWRALAGHKSNSDFAEGGFSYQANKVYLAADMSSSSASQTLRLNAQGGLVAIDGGLYASKRLQDSYALVEVKDYSGVGVGLNNGSWTTTNSDGTALITRLQAYRTNSIRLNANDLPFSAELDSIEQQAVPAWRSGVKVTYPVRSGRGALIRIVLEDGQAAPAGAEVSLPNDSKEFFVARRGEAFVTGLSAKNRLTLKWKDQKCSLAFKLPDSQPDEILRVGPLTCKGVIR